MSRYIKVIECQTTLTIKYGERSMNIHNFVLNQPLDPLNPLDPSSPFEPSNPIRRNPPPKRPF